jgi:Lamin Tail Domain
MHKLGRLALIAAFALVGFGAQGARPSTAEAAGCVQVYRIYYNSPGTDYGSNTSLNAEWIQLKNHCSTGRSLHYWKLRDAASHWYTFGTYTLKAYSTVKLHTGKGTNTSTDRYQGRSWYVWNNDTDTAYLYNSSGTRVDSCYYNNRNASSTYC